MIGAILLLVAAQANAAQLEFVAGLAGDFPTANPLPGLSSGYGWAFGLGYLPTGSFGFSLGANSTLHTFDAGESGGRDVRKDARRVAIYGQLRYRFWRFKEVDCELHGGVTYNTISGGDSSGAYLEYDLDPDDIGYSGPGIGVSLGLVRRISSTYYAHLRLIYNAVEYRTHQVGRIRYTGRGHRQDGSSLGIGIGITYRVELGRL